MATFTEYLAANCKTKVKAEANERWQTRILPKNLEKMGHQGAEEYLAQYGKGISGRKVVQSSLKAELESFYEMALGFWLKAYELETGTKADPSEYIAPSGGTSAKSSPTSSIKKAVELPPSILPKHLQPGKLFSGYAREI